MNVTAEPRCGPSPAAKAYVAWLRSATPRLVGNNFDVRGGGTGAIAGGLRHSPQSRQELPDGLHFYLYRFIASPRYPFTGGISRSLLTLLAVFALVDGALAAKPR